MTSQPPGPGGPEPEAYESIEPVEAADSQPPAPPGSTSSSNTLTLGSDATLRIDKDSLLVQGGIAKSNSKSRSCGVCIPGSPGSSKARSIPLYNILWAELSQDQRTLTIDFAENVSKTELRATKLSFPTASAAGESPPTPSDAITKWAAELLAQSYGAAPRKKRAYVLVNPHAGPGGAQKKWNQHVKPIFEAARMPLTIHTTTRSREAIDLCAEMNIDQFDIVVPCSGDGLAYECFNGLGGRADARRALQKIAVAHIPCGSGNALACNAFGTHRASLAALAIVKGVPTPMDLISITQQHRDTGGGGGGDSSSSGSSSLVTRSLSFLSQTLGIMADADLGTEHLRWMGEHRFTYGTITRILKKKTYPCDLWAKVEMDHKDDVRAHYRRERENGSVAAELDGSATATTSTSTTMRTRVGREGSSAESEVERDGNGMGLPPLKYGSVSDKLPEGWVKIPADDIGTFYAGNLAYMAPDVIFHNAALISDGLMDVYTIGGAVPAGRVPGLLAASFGNGFIDHDLVKYYKVAAFRIVPKYATGEGEVGFISVDGEAVPFGPLQAEVHQGLGMIITKRGVLEAPGPRDWDKVTPLERIRA